MNTHTSSHLQPSSGVVRLDEIHVPMHLDSGEANLFLIALHEGGELGAHIFVRSVYAGDNVGPVPIIKHEGQDYLYALIAVRDCQWSPCSQWDEEAWIQSWDDAIQREFGFLRQQDDDDVYLTFIQAAQADDSRRLKIAKDNQAMVQHDLVNKIERLGSMASIHLTTKSQDKQETEPLYLAMQVIASVYRLPFDANKDILLDKQLPAESRIEQFCQNANWRVRKVLLERDFYKQSAMPLLCFRQSTGDPLIIFPSAQGSTYIDPKTPTQKRELRRSVARDIVLSAYCFYELFPEGKLTKKKLIKFVFANARNIFIMTILVGIASSILGMVSPVATAYITSQIIPTANLPELWQVTALLIVLLACQTLIGVVPSLISMIFSARQYERFQAAVFDHILRIPVQSLKTCDAGDMTQRVLGANQIQSTLTSLVSQQFLSSIFALSSLAMMFYYSTALSFAGMGMVIIYALSFFLLSRFNLKPLALHAAASGRMSGLMKQFFDGVSKIRSAGAEQRVISRFMDDFSVASTEEYKISKLGAYQSILSTIFPMLISLVFYAMAGGMMSKNMDFPIFLAFMAAFQNFQGGVMGLADGLWTLLSIKPEVDRIMPVLESEVEDKGEKHLPGVLNGDVELAHINFRYAPDAPLILKDVSLHAKAGEFVAIVGASGAGKSTLVRLLLGFEKYESGGIYYSGKELVNLNLRAVRRQLGVILQNSKVMPASILENITTGTQYTEEDAFEALKFAAYDDEVRALPMGIHTMVSPYNISGGQQQRILIARALIGRPVAVIMDESTSALDNVAQQIVKTNMEELNMTRIVIAHRLSTIINADRIYVMNQGRVVAQGTYTELLAQDGVFKDLVMRQQLSKGN